MVWPLLSHLKNNAGFSTNFFGLKPLPHRRMSITVIGMKLPQVIFGPKNMKSHLIGDVNWNLIQGTEQGQVTGNEIKFGKIFENENINLGVVDFVHMGESQKWPKNFFSTKKSKILSFIKLELY